MKKDLSEMNSLYLPCYCAKSYRKTLFFNSRTDTNFGDSAIFFAEQNFDVCLVWNTPQGQEWDFERDFRYFFLTFANNLFLNLKTETVQNITMQIPKYNVKD